jgi:serine/threonine-protein kinase
MPPEQAAGALDRMGPASDVYSLGGILYNILTDRRRSWARTVSTTLQKVQRGEFPSPRQIDRTVPRALEAICLKAMALRPRTATPTARALAADVEHWLADEPVSVYREPWTVRLARWGRRHKTAVSCVAALLITAVTGLAIGNFLIGREKARTERNYRLARAAVEQMLTTVGAVDLADVPQMEAVRQDLLQRALRFYQAFLQERGNEAALRRDTAEAHGRLADVQEMLGAYDQAEPQYRAAIAMLRSWRPRRPGGPSPGARWPWPPTTTASC